VLYEYMVLTIKSVGPYSREMDVAPVKYELDLYILRRRNSVFKGLIIH
jgi:hypothetical protein